MVNLFLALLIIGKVKYVFFLNPLKYIFTKVAGITFQCNILLIIYAVYTLLTKSFNS